MSNNILVITSNPEKDSMTDAVGAAFAAGAVERGASADVLDLYDEGFNPVYSAVDRAIISAMPRCPRTSCLSSAGSLRRM